MAEVLRASNSLAGEMADTVEPLGLSGSFADLNMAAAAQGHHHQQQGHHHQQQQQQQQGSQNYVIRLPRRAFSCTDQQISILPQVQGKQHINASHTPRQPTEAAGVARAQAQAQAQAQRRDDALAVVYQRLLRNPSSGRNSPARIPTPPAPQQHSASNHHHRQPTTTTTTTAATTTAATARPGMPLAPQRSYSVMDVEPVPLTHQPGTALTLPDLPAELHYAIFDLLDPIDGTCLGLASRQFYAIFRHINLHSLHHGKNDNGDGGGKPKYAAPQLGARREGPNDMEWVWRHAGPFVSTGSGSGGGSGGGKQNTLAVLSPRGQVYCRKCRTARCELHKHIRDFFPADWEYCEVAQKFGRAADDDGGDARPVCYRSSPRHPHRCGRHTRRQRAVRLV
ncbi:hypothetical protein SLS62_008386 [Diatrype stigma]|uniref:F-box domain-containing protein n=1 Tax=Diatrype stigma TaxID=117547 RepID=A0AAN9UTC5_9PEZI